MDNQGDPSPNPGLPNEVVNQIITLLLGGLSLVAALAWNDAVRQLFDRIFPKGGGLIAKFMYAVFVTVVIVIISLRLRQLKPKK